MDDLVLFDYSKLRGKIREIFGTQDKFAEKLGICRTSLSLRLNNGAQFSQKEMHKAAILLGIPKEQYSTYFFEEKVQKHEQ